MTKLWKKYILWFAQEHVDFRVAEFESIVKLFGLQFRNLSEHRLVTDISLLDLNQFQYKIYFTETVLASGISK